MDVENISERLRPYGGVLRESESGKGYQIAFGHMIFSEEHYQLMMEVHPLEELLFYVCDLRSLTRDQINRILSLKKLGIISSQITDATLENMEDLKNLRHLKIHDVSLGKETIAYLSSLNSRIDVQIS